MSFFKDGNGKYSMARLLSFIITLGTIPLMYIHPELTTEIAVLLGAAMAAKTYQKGQEK